MSDCVFCKIVSGEIPSNKVYEDDKIIVINISGRGDKDVAAIARYRGEDLHE